MGVLLIESLALRLQKFAFLHVLSIALLGLEPSLFYALQQFGYGFGDMDTSGIPHDEYGSPNRGLALSNSLELNQGDPDDEDLNLPPDEFPHCDESGKTLLVVILTDLKKEHHVKIAQHVRRRTGSPVKLWTPSTALLQSITPQSTHRDSQANIHAIGLLARRSGLVYTPPAKESAWRVGYWKVGTFFMVVDERAGRYCSIDSFPSINFEEFWTTSFDEVYIIPLLLVTVREGPPHSDFIRSYGSYRPDPSFDFFGPNSPTIDSGLGIVPGFEADATNQVNTDRWGIRVAIRRIQAKDIGEAFQMFDSTIRDPYGGRYVMRREPLGGDYRDIDHIRGDGMEDVDDRLEYERGMVLRNPDRGIFTVECRSHPTRDECLQSAFAVLSPLLPPELVFNVLRCMDDEPRVSKPLWSERQNDKHTHILVLFETNGTELGQLKSTLLSAAQRDAETKDHTFELISWEQHQIRSRRDLFTFWEEYTRHDPDLRLGKPNLYMILNPVKESELQNAQFVIGMSSDSFFGKESGYLAWRDPSVFLRTSFDAVLHQEKMRHCGEKLTPKNYRSESYMAFCKRYGIYGAETSYNPIQPFWHNPAFDYQREEDLVSRQLEFRTNLWSPVQANMNIKTRELSKMTGSISVFYLFRALPAEKLKFARKIGNRDATFADWEEEEDGTWNSIWDIVLDIYKRDEMGFRCSRFVCIDRQTLSDKTALLVEPDFYLSGKRIQAQGVHLQGMAAPTLSGYSYGRIPTKKASWVLKDLGSMVRVFDELDLEGEGQFVRPDWPAPGTLPPENPYRSGWPRPPDSGYGAWEIFERFQSFTNF